jgi:class 3 adenylate cyclase
MAEKLIRKRIDLQIKRIKKGDDPNQFHFEMEFDPRRYEWLEQDGERCLYDKFEKALIPERVVLDMVGRLNGLPVYHQPPLISNSAEYVVSRQNAIADRLRGVDLDEEPNKDPSAEFLDSHSGSELGFAILCIDLVGSTRLSIESDSYARIVSTYVYEVSRVVPLFRGHVLKHMGDGLIAYFAEPSFNIKNDLAVDCALTMRALILDGINPALSAIGLARLSFRIGLEAGDAFVDVIGSATTKRHSDIVGKVVSIAAKIQAISPVDGIGLGEGAVSALHVSWRQRVRPLVTDSRWQVRKRDRSEYAVYELALDSRGTGGEQ